MNYQILVMSSGKPFPKPVTCRFYTNKNPASPVQPTRPGKATDWIGYDHNYSAIVTKLLSRYDSNGKQLSGWTGTLGVTLIDSTNNKVLGYTGDENIPVEKDVYKHKLQLYDITGTPRIFAEQVLSGSILSSNGLYKFTIDDNIVYTNFYPKMISVRDVNNKLLRTELIVTSGGNGSYPNQYKFTNQAYCCSPEDLTQVLSYTVRFYYKSNNITQIKNISDTGYEEILNTYPMDGYKEGRN